MKIALLTLGTRGDVQPYAVLGRALKERGHIVTLSTAKNFESLAKSYNINFEPVDADFQALLESEEGKKMMKNPFRARKHLSSFVYPMMSDALATFYKLAKESDKVLFHIKTLADHFADQFPEKMIRANVIPALEPTRAFANPVFSALPLPAALNKFSYKLTELGLNMWRRPIAGFRKKFALPLQYQKVHLPSVYGISKHFLNKPADYPDDSFFTGFWTDNSAGPLETNLSDFIKSGAPPLLITFGSMPFNSGLNLPAVLTELAETLKQRLIIVKGWGLKDTGALEGKEHIKVVASAPYDRLFPFVKAVIHHGGIGTIASCLHAGKPFLACPVLYPVGDQYFWGTVAYKKGVALKPVPIKKMTAELLIQNAKALLHTESLYKKSSELMELLKRDNGLLNAAAIIESDHRRNKDN